jgi:hypothetical protein
MPTCIFCKADVSHKKFDAKYCDAVCATKFHSAKRKQEAYNQRKLNHCEICGISLQHRRSNRAIVCGDQCYKLRVAAKRTPPEKRKPGSETCLYCLKKIALKSKQYYCSKDCRAKNRWKLKLQSKPSMICINPFCEKVHQMPNGSKCCSLDCQSVINKYTVYGKGAGESQAIHKGFLEASRIQFVNCRDCGMLLAAKIHGTNKICLQCRKKIDNKNAARKNHQRRALGVVLTVHELAQRDGTSCHICGKKVNMKLSGRTKYGPTIEHIFPVSLGGDNSRNNLALAHRHCNVSRGNRGHSQLLLIA